MTLFPLLMCFTANVVFLFSFFSNRWILSLQFFHNNVCLSHEHQNTKKYEIWCRGWSGVDIWLWKVGFTPLSTRHTVTGSLRDGDLSISGAQLISADGESQALRLVAADISTDIYVYTPEISRARSGKSMDKARLKTADAANISCGWGAADISRAVWLTKCQPQARLISHD